MTARAVAMHGSWADELSSRVARAPVPAAVVYFAIWLVLVGVLAVVHWAFGGDPGTAIHPFALYALGLVVTFPWLIGVFNRRASSAIRAADPLVIGGPDRVATLERELVQAPARVTLLAALAIFLGTATRVWINPSILTTMGFSDPPVLWLEIALSWPLIALSAAAFVVKFVHLGWQVHRVTTRELRVDLWDLGPLMAFSVVTAAMAASLVLLELATVIVAPGIYSDAFGVTFALTTLAIAVTVFVLPLLGLHARIVAAKQLEEGQLAREMERAIGELRRAGAADDLSRMDPLNKQIGAIEAAQRSVARIPTWPWQPELVRWIVGALLFPIVLFVLQAVIGRLLPA